MQISVEQLEGLQRRMTVQIPANDVDQKVHSRLQSLTRKARIDGFRPGKVPLKVIKKMYGGQVRREVLSEVMEQSFQDALKEQQLRPAGGPKVEPLKLDEGQDFEYAATFEVFPEFTPNTIVGHKIVRPVAEITDADIDNMIENLRKQRTEWNEVERPAEEQDRVTLSFEGKLDGKDFAGNKGENAQIVIGSGSMIADFEQKLTGLASNTTADLEVQFPEDYHAKELAGKQVLFHVQMHKVEEPQLPEVNEDFIKQFGIEDNSLETFRGELRQNMERELQQAVKTHIKRQVMDAVAAEHDIEVPQALVDAEINNLAKQAGVPEDSDDADDEQRNKSLEFKRKIFEQEAKRRVKLALIIAELTSSNDIQLDDARVQVQLENVAAAYQDSDEVIQWYRQNPNMMQGIYDMALEEQVIDWLLESAEVVEQSMEFDDLIKQAQGKSEIKSEITSDEQTDTV